MRRWFGLGAIVVAVGLVLGAAGGRAQTQDEKIVSINTMSVRDTLYQLTVGDATGMALIDEINGGVVLVDAGLSGWGQPVRDAVEEVTELLVTTIITTHAHADHAGSNGEFGPGVQIVAHGNTQANMAKMSGVNAASLPTTTFTDRFSLLDGRDRIELYYFGAGHTDGDIIVVFADKGVAYVGDLFPSKSTPVIDTDLGGSGVAFPDTLAKAVAGIQGVTRVIIGHGPTPMTYAGRGRRDRRTRRAWSGYMTWEDLAEYADFNRDFLSAVEDAFRAGKSVAEAAETLALPERYADYGMEHARANVEAIYNELAAR